MRKKSIRLLAVLLAALLMCSGSFNALSGTLTVHAEEGDPSAPPETQPSETPPPETQPSETPPPETQPTEPTEPQESGSTDPWEESESETEPTVPTTAFVKPPLSAYVAATQPTGAPPIAPLAETTPAPETETETEDESGAEDESGEETGPAENPNIDYENSIAGKYGLMEDESSEEETGLSLEPGVITTNVSFFGKSLQGLTAEEGTRLIRSAANDALSKKIVTSGENGEYETSLSALGFSCSSLSDVQKQLEAAVPNGNLLERYMKAKDIQLEPVDMSFDLNGGSQQQIIDLLTEKTQDWITEPQSASVSFMSGERVVTPSTNGTSYDFTNGASQLLEDVSTMDILKCGDPYVLDSGEEVVHPELTTERASNFTILGSYTTYYHAPNTQIYANREQNLIVSASNMNGRRFAPGERISALSMYGDVTYDNGYREAGTIVAGHHQDALGGGICQTTTTLYNAVLYAELQVVYRSNHSMVSNYVSPSRDAMVYYAGWDHSSNMYDFVFNNSSSDYIYIESFVDRSNLAITVRIIGHEDHAPGRSVEYVSEILSMTAPNVNLVIDPTLVNTDAAYAKLYYQIGDDGAEPAMHSRLWKIVYQDGVEVARYLQNPGDRYKPQDTTYAVAQGVYIYCECVPGGSYQDCYLQYKVVH